MKKLFLVSCLFGLGAGALVAQESELEALKRALREQQKTIESLIKKVETLEHQQAGVTNEQAQLKRLVETPVAQLPSPVTEPLPGKKWSPSDPIRLSRGAAYMELGAVATFATGGSSARDIEGGTQPGGHDPNQRGFTVQGLELNLKGAVDPYFRGNANKIGRAHV